MDDRHAMLSPAPEPVAVSAELAELQATARKLRESYDQNVAYLRDLVAQVDRGEQGGQTRWSRVMLKNPTGGIAAGTPLLANANGDVFPASQSPAGRSAWYGHIDGTLRPTGIADGNGGMITAGEFTHVPQERQQQPWTRPESTSDTVASRYAPLTRRNATPAQAYNQMASRAPRPVAARAPESYDDIVRSLSETRNDNPTIRWNGVTAIDHSMSPAPLPAPEPTPEPQVSAAFAQTLANAGGRRQVRRLLRPEPAGPSQF